jgi:hypothetical protein
MPELGFLDQKKKKKRAERQNLIAKADLNEIVLPSTHTQTI